MGWNLKKSVHAITRPIEKGVKKLTGSDTVAKAVTNFGLAPVAVAHKFVPAVAHGVAHLGDLLKPKGADPEEEAPAEEAGVDLSGVEDALAQLAEYQALALAASQRQEPAAEPLKAAQDVYSGTQDDTRRLQLMRRGLMSTFTRYGGGFGGRPQTLGV